MKIIKFGLQGFSFPDTAVQVLKLVFTTQSIFGNGALDVEELLFKKEGNTLQLL